MTRDLTQGNEIKALVVFSLPLMAGNALQQLYNVADTWAVGQFVGADALAAVGTAFALMVFLTSMLIGFSMGCGAVFSTLYGARQERRLRESLWVSFLLVAFFTVVITLAAFLFLEPILTLLQVDRSIRGLCRDYLRIIFLGIPFVAVYNFAAAVLRGLGNSAAPVACAALSSVLNVGLDLVFILPLGMGVAGAAWATVLSQGVSALLICLYLRRGASFLWPEKDCRRFHRSLALWLLRMSALTSVQQSIMNFGILMVQGLVNSFGVAATAAFAAGVKIDAFAYMPVQDLGNAFSTYIAQNCGARRFDRIRRGSLAAAALSGGFGVVVSAAVFLLARPLMSIFVQAGQEEILAIGVTYLRIEGAFYFAIGWLFLLYGFYRGMGRAGMSVVLTVCSLGLRVALAYLLAPQVGLTGIWWAIPIGWLTADAVGIGWCLLRRRVYFGPAEARPSPKAGAL